MAGLFRSSACVATSNLTTIITGGPQRPSRSQSKASPKISYTTTPRFTESARNRVGDTNRWANSPLGKLTGVFRWIEAKVTKSLYRAGLLEFRWARKLDMVPGPGGVLPRVNRRNGGFELSQTWQPSPPDLVTAYILRGYANGLRWVAPGRGPLPRSKLTRSALAKQTGSLSTSSACLHAEKRRTACLESARTAVLHEQ